MILGSEIHVLEEKEGWFAKPGLQTEKVFRQAPTIKAIA
jgi:hypothetical protein